MGFIDKMKGMFSEEEVWEEEEEGGYGASTEIPYEPFKKEPVKTTVTEPAQVNRGKVVNIHATTQLQVMLVKPERFEDARTIADHLNQKRTVVLNLESASKELSRRLLDFLSGVAYANGGAVKRVANSTYIITPSNVNLMGDLLDELESSGVYF